MRIKITKDGIYGNDGSIPIGTEFDVDDEPVSWAGRYEIIADDAPATPKGKTAVTNPAVGALPKDK